MIGAKTLSDQHDLCNAAVYTANYAMDSVRSVQRALQTPGAVPAQTEQLQLLCVQHAAKRLLHQRGLPLLPEDCWFRLSQECGWQLPFKAAPQ